MIKATPGGGYVLVPDMLLTSLNIIPFPEETVEEGVRNVDQKVYSYNIQPISRLN